MLFQTLSIFLLLAFITLGGPVSAVDQEYERVGREYFSENIRKVPVAGQFENETFKPNMNELYLMPSKKFPKYTCPSATDKIAVLVIAATDKPTSCKITFDTDHGPLNITNLNGEEEIRTFYFPIACVDQNLLYNTGIDDRLSHYRVKANSDKLGGYDSGSDDNYTIELKRSSENTVKGFIRVLPFTIRYGIMGPYTGTTYHLAGEFTANICNFN